MKRNFLILLLVIFAGSTALPALADNNPEDKKVTVTAIRDNLVKNPDVKLSEEELQCLVDRLNEIRDMNKKQLAGEEKRALKKEVKDIKEILKQQDYVLYISMTALLLIIILILIL